MIFYFLGTGAGVPSRMRNVSSLALVMPEYGGQTWLFDCGEATQHQILVSPVKLSKVSHIWITHLHGDHLYGLPRVLGSRSFQGAETPLTVYGPPGLAEFIEISLKTSRTFLRYPLKVEEIADGSRFTEGAFSILVKKLDHGIPSFGFRLMEKEQPGRLDAKRLKEIGVPPGPVYKELKEGKTVLLPDGRHIDGKEFLSPPVPGRIIAILGDTRVTKTAFELAGNADILIHESTYRAGQEELAFSFFHSTCTQAAEVAKQSGAKRLILNHISSRFQEEDCAELLEEARSVFPQTLLAHDGFEYELPVREVKQKQT
jgi:ribonuclease Z